jgi:hypothetical protein
MAKLFVIKIHEETEKAENCFSQREFDKTILKEFLKLYGTKQTDFTRYFSIKETIDQIDSLEGNEIKLDKEQISFLREGFKLSPGATGMNNKPLRAIWDEYENGLYKQIHEPEEIEV